MEGTKATTILDEILQKLSLLTKEDELAQDIMEEEVQEEVLSSESKEEAVEEVAEELNEESTEEVAEVEAEEEVELMEGYVTEEDFKSAISAMKSELDALKEAVKGELQEYKSQKEDLSKQLEKLSEEPAAEPIKHSPEADSKGKLDINLNNSNRPVSTMGRVLSRINS
jgi:predicted RNase H-like nuclease (RuvC/YqgF family)